MGWLSRWISREAAIFWSITVLVCAIVGVVSFVAGRDWVGRYLAEQQTGRSSTNLSVSEPDSSQRAIRMAPIVVIREREPTEAELRELSVSVSEEAEGSEQSEEPQPEEASGEAERTESVVPGEATSPEAAASSEEVSPSEEASAEQGQWIATAGSYKDRRNAEEVVSSLNSQGLRAEIAEVTVRGEKYNRVKVGGFASRDEAEAAAEKIRAAGYPSQVMREQ